MDITYSGTPLKVITRDLNNYDIHVQGQIEQIALAARSLIAERLKTLMKSGADHFDVTIRPNPGLGYTITVGASDEIGVFLFEGVGEHEITGTAMPIGNGRFANVVHHPGYESRSPLIYQAVIEGVIGALEVVNLG
jgi:hypothetical protein